MARTKGAKSRQFTDHAGNQYTVIQSAMAQDSPICKLSVHLYTLSTLSPSPEFVGRSLLRSDTFVSSVDVMGLSPRVDVYAPQPSIKACIEHHRAEKAYRARAKDEFRRKVAADATAAAAAAGEAEDGEAAQQALRKLGGKEPLPHIVPTWCVSAAFWDKDRHRFQERYRSFILVVPDDCSTWEEVEEKGLWLVKFDQDVSPAMEVDAAGDAASKYEADGVRVNRRDCGPPVSIKRVSVVEDSDPRASLRDEWTELTGVFNDCTYRSVHCEGCFEANGRPHGDCGVER